MVAAGGNGRRIGAAPRAPHERFASHPQRRGPARRHRRPGHARGAKQRIAAGCADGGAQRISRRCARWHVGVRGGALGRIGETRIRRRGIGKAGCGEGRGHGAPDRQGRERVIGKAHLVIGGIAKVAVAVDTGRRVEAQRMHERHAIGLADKRDVDFGKARLGDAVRPGGCHLRAGLRGTRHLAYREVGVPAGDIVVKCPLAADRRLDRAARQLEQGSVGGRAILDLVLDGLALLAVIQNLVDHRRVAGGEIVGVHRIAGETRAGNQRGRQNAADGGLPHRLSQQTGIDRSLEAIGGAAAIIDHSDRLPVAERQVHRQLGRDLEHLYRVRIGITLVSPEGAEVEGDVLRGFPGDGLEIGVGIVDCDVGGA